MSRIEEALRRAKASHDEHAGKPVQAVPARSKSVDHRDRASSVGRGSTAGFSVFDEFWSRAQTCLLSSEIMHENRIMSDDQPLAIRSAYKMLRTRLLQRMRANGWTKLGVSSARAGAGKTVTAINTALSIAREPNQRVILIDLDLRRPSIARYLGLEPKHDLADFLLDKVEIDEVILRTSIDDLLVIPSTSTHENSSELLSSQRMQDLMQLLSTDSDGTVFLFDFPPMLDADDLLAFSPNIDALLFIVAECETRRADLEQVEDMIKDLEVLGVVLNKSDDRSPTYY